MTQLGFLLFALLQLAVPLICVIDFGASYFWLVGSLSLCIAVGLSIDRDTSLSSTALASILSGGLFAGNLLLGASYYVQGEGFNDQFFYHLDTESISMAKRSYASFFYPSLIALLSSFIAPFFLRYINPKRLISGYFVSFFWLIAVAANYPLLSYASYNLNSSSRPAGFYEKNAELTLSEREYLSLLAQNPESFRKKNIILIYAESLEQLYFDTTIFKEDLLPRLRILAEKSHNFTNVRQVSGASATITGIIASQCGFPVRLSTHLATNSTLSSVEDPFPNERCFADILSDRYYQTVFMGGAPLSFAGKRKFLASHGYSRMYGEEELSPKLANRDYVHGWGLYDDSLFDLARDELGNLEKSGRPYLLTLLTVDTHHPAGFLSKSCEPLPDNSDRMANAIYCSDQLISRFISDAKALVDMDNTVIVLFSDHLSMRNSYWEILSSQQENRRLNFMIFDNEEGVESNVPASHFDVAPTILEAAGIPGNLKVGAGQSLFYSTINGKAGTLASAESVQAPTLLASKDSANDTGVVISVSDLSISIGETKFVASEQGRAFTSGMYLVVFDQEGHPLDAIYSQDYASLAEGLNDKFVVGVSLFADRPNKPSYFYGRITWDGSEIVQRALYRDVELTPMQVSKEINQKAELKSGATDNKFRANRVAHAGGGLDGRTYTNSYDALDSNLKRGFRYFEIDFSYTADKRLVCIHDWHGNFRSSFGFAALNVPTLKEFEVLTLGKTKTKNCTLQGLAHWMVKNPAAYIVTDVKEDNLRAIKTIASVLPDAFVRVIPQIYNPKNYAKVKALGFEQMILTLYRYTGNLSDLLVQVQKWQGDFAITMPAGVARTGFAEHLRSLGIPSYVHTINDPDEAEQLMHVDGVSEIYTDFLVPTKGG
jgi:glycerophosphoryl diester phosphodiesterase